MDTLLTDWTPTRENPLPMPVPFRIVHEPLELRDSVLVLHPDVYRRESRSHATLVMERLAAGGLDTARVAQRAASSEKISSTVVSNSRAICSARSSDGT